MSAGDAEMMSWSLWMRTRLRFLRFRDSDLHPLD